MDIEFVYVGDPMCSWCWGFAPVLERMTEVYEIPVRVMVGGLRPGPDAEVLDDRLAGILAHHWLEVERASGQPFDLTFLERRDGWRYDTELPAIAVVTMREIDGSQVLDFHSRLQRAFYSEGVDITDLAVYAELVSDFDVDPQEFSELLSSEEMKKLAWSDFARSRSMGVSGFPTLLVREEDHWGVITRGFMPTQKLLPVLSDWLLDSYEVTGASLFCEPGTIC